MKKARQVMMILLGILMVLAVVGMIAFVLTRPKEPAVPEETMLWLTDSDPAAESDTGVVDAGTETESNRDTESLPTVETTERPVPDTEPTTSESETSRPESEPVESADIEFNVGDIILDPNPEVLGSTVETGSKERD